MYYKCHKVYFRRGGSYIDFADWIKKKKTTINPKNTDDKCFQYAATVALNYEDERISNIKPFMNKYNWKGINYPSRIDEKINSNFEKQIILLMISNEEKF